MEKICLVYHESVVNGEDPDFNVTPCMTLQRAREVMESEVAALLSDNPAYADADVQREDPYSVYITDGCGNSEYLHIEMEEIQ